MSFGLFKNINTLPKSTLSLIQEPKDAKHATYGDEAHRHDSQCLFNPKQVHEFE